MLSRNSSTTLPAYGIGIPRSERASILPLQDDAVHALTIRYSAGAEGMLAQHAAADTACSRHGLLWGIRQADTLQGSPEAGLWIEEATALPNAEAFGVVLQDSDVDRLVQYASRRKQFLLGSYTVWPKAETATPWAGVSFRGMPCMDAGSAVLQKRFVHLGIRWKQRRLHAFRVPPPRQWGALESAAMGGVV